MALFRRKADPVSERARALNSEIAALQAEIQKHESLLGQTVSRSERRDSPFAQSTSQEQPPQPRAQTVRPELDIEDVDQRPLTNVTGTPPDPVHLNELGMRKYDLPSFFSRLRNHFRAPTTSNPKLVSYLAAGGIQGLRPLRYEERIARNRFMLLVGILFLLLLGILTVFVR